VDYVDCVVTLLLQLVVVGLVIARCPVVTLLIPVVVICWTFTLICLLILLLVYGCVVPVWLLLPVVVTLCCYTRYVPRSRWLRWLRCCWLPLLLRLLLLFTGYVDLFTFTGC